MEKTLKATKHIKAKNIFRLVNQMWQSMETKSKRGWRVSSLDFNEDYTEVKIFYEKTIKE